MTREEALKVAKPILFNTEMVREILDGRKTVTRRVVKYKYSNTEMKMSTNKYGTRLIEIQKDIEGETYGKYPDGRTWRKLRPYIEKEPLCKKGDILYVRETWTKLYYVDPDGYTHYDQEMYFYAADGIPDITLMDADGFEEDDQRIRWHPSIHMPKEAARIFLRVTDARVERLQKMETEDDKNYIAEGAQDKHDFIRIWDSTVKNKDVYGWYANPWVWVIKFEWIEVR